MPSTKSKICSGYRPVTSSTTAAITARMPISPRPAQLWSCSPYCHANHSPDPVNRPTMMYCGMASSHHFTSASPRDSCPG